MRERLSPTIVTTGRPLMGTCTYYILYIMDILYILYIRRCAQCAAAVAASAAVQHSDDVVFFSSGVAHPLGSIPL